MLTRRGKIVGGMFGSLTFFSYLCIQKNTPINNKYNNPNIRNP